MPTITKLMTADLSDAHPEAQVTGASFRDFGGLSVFHGKVATLKVFEDNALVRTILEEPGDGRVLAIDGGGSLRCALVGGNLAQLAVSNGWRGIVVNGCVRDSAEIRATALGVKAIGSHPRKSEKGLHGGQRGGPVSMAGITFREGQWLYADEDGMLLSDLALHAI